MQIEQAKYPRNPKDEVKRTPAGPMIIIHDTDYFIPQWDEQILGPAWRQQRGKWDYDNPPQPLLPDAAEMKDAFKYCEQCQLTWLVGHDKEEGHKHPQHYAWKPEAEHIDVHRWGLEPEASIIVYVHGACIAEGEESKSIVANPAGTGIFFGKGSKYNMAAPQGNKSTPFDRERAELGAILLALTQVRWNIVEDRTDFLKELARSKIEAGKAGGAGRKELDGESDSVDGSSEIEDEEDIDLSFRVIVVSDNKQVVDNICELEDKEPAKHGDLYDGLDDLIDELDEVDIDVRWYCVPEGVNKEAAALANQALEGHFEGHTKEYKPKKDQ